MWLNLILCACATKQSPPTRAGAPSIVHFNNAHIQIGQSQLVMMEEGWENAFSQSGPAGNEGCVTAFKSAVNDGGGGGGGGGGGAGGVAA